MNYKILSFDNLKSLRNVMLSRKDLNGFAQFQFNSNDLQIKCMDTFYLTQVTVVCNCTEYKTELACPVITTIDLESEQAIHFLSLIPNQKRALAIGFGNQTPIHIVDPNTQVLLVNIPFKQDSCLQYITPQIETIDFSIRYVIADLLSSLLNLSLCNAIIQLSLHNNLLLLQAKGENGQIEVCKQLNINKQITFESKYGIKYIKVLSTLASNLSHCNFVVDVITKQIHICIQMNDAMRVIFTLCHYRF